MRGVFLACLLFLLPLQASRVSGYVLELTLLIIKAIQVHDKK